MAKTKQGDSLSCSVCGLIVTVDEVCGCDETVVVCCEQPMVKGKLAASKVRKKMANAKIAASESSGEGTCKTGEKTCVKKVKEGYQKVIGIGSGTYLTKPRITSELKRGFVLSGVNVFWLHPSGHLAICPLRRCLVQKEIDR